MTAWTGRTRLTVRCDQDRNEVNIPEDKPRRQTQDAELDRAQIAWWHKQLREIHRQYRGATNAINRCHADYEDTCNAIDELRARIDSQDAALQEALALIGELREQNSALSARMDAAAKYMQERLPKGDKG